MSVRDKQHITATTPGTTPIAQDPTIMTVDITPCPPAKPALPERWNLGPAYHIKAKGWLNDPYAPTSDFHSLGLDTMAFMNSRRGGSSASHSAGTHHDASATTTTVRPTFRKGATFHSVSVTTATASPLPSTAPCLSHSKTDLGDVVDAHVRRADLVIADLDPSLSINLDDLAGMLKKSTLTDIGSPIPRSLLDLYVPSPDSRRPSLASQGTRPHRPRTPSQYTRFHDSGLGSSSSSSTAESKTGFSPSRARSVHAVSMSAAVSSTICMEQVQGLGNQALNRIYEYTLRPLRSPPQFKIFEPILADVPLLIRAKQITCLRDVEKTLLFLAPERAKYDAALCLDFCRASIRCIQATVEYLSDREQIRTNDRPYTNGYFLSLEEQLNKYALQLSAHRKSCPSTFDIEDEEERQERNYQLSPDLDSTDEVRLFGGIAMNGRPVELVRVQKDGRAVSLTTGKQVDLGNETAPVQVKRSLSDVAEDEEEILRSMARRKKGALPEPPVQRPCSHCNKIFTRQCDRAKHEKTHKRPHKCPHLTCKYHEDGWPTEKELSRHINDKHNANPDFFACSFDQCPYKSKRQSNCKQHMEKAHGWVYQRSKNAGGAHSGRKTVGYQESQTVDMLTPISNEPYCVLTPPPERMNHAPAHADSLDHLSFPSYPTDQEYLASRGSVPLTNDEMEADLAALHDQLVGSHQREGHFGQDFAPYGSTFHDSDGFIVRDELYAAAAHVPHHTIAQPFPGPYQDPLDTVGKLVPVNYDNHAVSSVMAYELSNIPVLSANPVPQQSHKPSERSRLSPLTPGAGSDLMFYTPSSLGDYSPPSFGMMDDCLDDMLRPHQPGPGEHCSGHLSADQDFTLFPASGFEELLSSNFALFNSQAPSIGLNFLSQPSDLNDLYLLQSLEGVLEAQWSSGPTGIAPHQSM